MRAPPIVTGTILASARNAILATARCNRNALVSGSTWSGK